MTPTMDANYTQFDGILVRSLALLQPVKGSSEVLGFWPENADAVLKNDRDGDDDILGSKLNRLYVGLGVRADGAFECYCGADCG